LDQIAVVELEGNSQGIVVFLELQTDIVCNSKSFVILFLISTVLGRAQQVQENSLVVMLSHILNMYVRKEASRTSTYGSQVFEFVDFDQKINGVGFRVLVDQERNNLFDNIEEISGGFLGFQSLVIFSGNVSRKMEKIFMTPVGKVLQGTYTRVSLNPAKLLLLIPSMRNLRLSPWPTSPIVIERTERKSE